MLAMLVTSLLAVTVHCHVIHNHHHHHILEASSATRHHQTTFALAPPSNTHIGVPIKVKGEEKVYDMWYEAKDNGGEKWAVFVNGIMESGFPRWDGFMDLFKENGYNTVRFDHFGRGFSQNIPPPYQYNRHHYCLELSSVLTHLNIKSPITLVGHSMGGAVSITCGVEIQNSVGVERMVLLAPAGFTGKPIEAMLLTPFSVFSKRLNKFLLETRTTEYKKELCKFLEPDGTFSPQFQNIQQIQDSFNHAHPRPFQALVSTVKTFPELFDVKKDFVVLLEARIPMLIVMGSQDVTVPIEPSLKSICKKLREHGGSPVSVGVIAASRHAFHLEHPEEIRELVANFLEGNGGEFGDMIVDGCDDNFRLNDFKKNDNCDKV